MNTEIVRQISLVEFRLKLADNLILKMIIKIWHWII